MFVRFRLADVKPDRNLSLCRYWASSLPPEPAQVLLALNQPERMAEFTVSRLQMLDRNA